MDNNPLLKEAFNRASPVSVPCSREKADALVDALTKKTLLEVVKATWGGFFPLGFVKVRAIFLYGILPGFTIGIIVFYFLFKRIC